MKPLFIDKKINIVSGDKAKEALKKENDLAFFERGKGVTRVSIERWLKAQECEKNHWMIRGIKSINDRNDYHEKQFEGYKSLKFMNFPSVIEIGCGPFTNARIIAKKSNINEITLLDPLINEYLNHPFARYNKNYLFVEYFPLIGKLFKKLFPMFFKQYLYLFSKKIKIKNLLDIPAEKISSGNSYDLVIMINVLEHCYDAELVLNNTTKITREGGFLIFEDKIYEADLVQEELNYCYDAAHPLKVDRSIIEKFLKENFEVVYKRIQTNSLIFEGEKIIWDDIYFIGVKKLKL